MSEKLEGKIAVITGGNSGIGLAAAKLFQAEGARVAITGRRQQAVDDAVKEIGGECTGFISDTSNLAAIKNLYVDIQKKFEHIDVLFLNAGVAKFGPCESVDESTFDEMVNINFKGLFFNVQHALPLMKAGGSIIFTSSIADQKGFATTTVYSATKAAVRSLARTLSAELVERNIRVNAIAAGPIETPIFEKLGMPAEVFPDVKEGFKSQVPMKRMGTPDEVAQAALFFASTDSSFITGVDLAVDGGMSQL